MNPRPERLFPARPIALALLAGLTACAGDGSRAGWLAAAPDPVHLQLELEHPAAAARIVTTAGGTLTTTAEDGTYYELRIPAGALDRATRIVMTPVSRVRGEPLEGRTAAAVRLQPDGLRLGELATLTIEPARDAPHEDLVAFGFFGGGEDAHLHPLGTDGGRVVLPLAHFSGYGIGHLPPGDPARQRLLSARDLEARLASLLGEAISEARRRPVNGESLWERVLPLFDDYVEGVLIPMARDAVDDDRLVRCALDRYLAILRQAQLLGLAVDGGTGALDEALAGGQSGAPRIDPEVRGLDRLAEVEALLAEAVRNAQRKMWERARRRCRESSDLDAYHDVVGLMRQYALLGNEAAAERGSRQLVEELQRCLSFELEFASVVDNTGPEVGFRYHVRGTAPFQLHVPGPDAGADPAPLEYVEFTAYGNPASALFGGDGAQGAGQGRTGTLAADLARELGSGEVSPAGTRPGELVVLAMDRAPVTDSVLVTRCDGSDAREVRRVADTVLLTIGIRRPTERIRTVGRIAGPSTYDAHNWADHWERFHRRQRVRMRERSEDEDVQYYQLELAPVRPGEWRVDYENANPPLAGISLGEKSHAVLRHRPK